METAKSTRALLLWCALFGILAAFLPRYGLLPVVSPLAEEGGSYLAGVYGRATQSLFYQAMLVALFGALAYSVAVLMTLGRWIRVAPRAVQSPSGFPDALAGMARCGPGTPGGWPRHLDITLQLATNPIRDAAVIFPAVGFIGTVVGVSIAIGGLDAVIENGETGPLLEGLRVAFDTTFIGLVGSVALTALMYLIQARSVVLRGLLEEG